MGPEWQDGRLRRRHERERLTSIGTPGSSNRIRGVFVCGLHAPIGGRQHHRPVNLSGDFVVTQRWPVWERGVKQAGGVQQRAREFSRDACGVREETWRFLSVPVSRSRNSEICRGENRPLAIVAKSLTGLGFATAHDKTPSGEPLGVLR